MRGQNLTTFVFLFKSLRVTLFSPYFFCLLLFFSSLHSFVFLSLFHHRTWERNIGGMGFSRMNTHKKSSQGLIHDVAGREGGRKQLVLCRWSENENISYSFMAKNTTPCPQPCSPSRSSQRNEEMMQTKRKKNREECFIRSEMAMAGGYML